MNKKQKIISSVIIIVLILGIISAILLPQGWIIYRAPEYRGRIIDAETKQPIKDVVIVAVYYKFPAFISLSQNCSIFKIREATTDEKGEFVIFALKAFLNPFYTKDQINFIIYKPGYASYGGSDIYPLNFITPDYVFTRKLGEKIDIQFETRGKVSFIGGIVELPPYKTEEKRLRAIPSPPTNLIKDTPLLFKAINNDLEYYGIGSIGR